MKLSQKDLEFAFGKPWQKNFTNKTAQEAFECDAVTIDYNEKDYLVTEGMRLSAANKVYKLLKGILVEKDCA